MAYKTILVNCDTAPTNDKRVETAAELARGTGAHLVGLFLRSNVVLPAYLEAGISPDLIALQEKRGKELAAKGKAAFDAICSRVGTASEWRDAQGDVYELGSMNARYADLVVMGQFDSSLTDPDIVPDLPETVALRAGRPVLILPYIPFRGPLMGGHVMVAWNASREATRAVSDALPFLQAAKTVTVLAVNPRAGARGHGEDPGADIALFLARHGVKVTSSFTISDDADPGDVVLSRMADLDVNLLVMGAYGHSRLREMVMGGVTRKILSSMTAPVLMSH
ncbi:MAG: universal stress protein [Reyranellaceae bacterium]